MTETDLVLDAVGEPNRRQLLELLHDQRESTVSELVDSSGLRQPQVSKHLKVLANAELVSVLDRRPLPPLPPRRAGPEDGARLVRFVRRRLARPLRRPRRTRLDPPQPRPTRGAPPMTDPTTPSDLSTLDARRGSTRIELSNDGLSYQCVRVFGAPPIAGPFGHSPTRPTCSSGSRPALRPGPR